MARKMGRNLIAREAHFRKAGPTEKTGHERIKQQRQADHLEEQEALREANADPAASSDASAPSDSSDSAA